MFVVVLIVVVLIIVFGPGLWVRRVMDKYSAPEDRYAGTGAQLARHLLNKHGLETVAVERTKDGDHYDPTEKVVRLTDDNFDGKSLTAITIAAHEFGHALQDHQGYGPLRWRTRLVRGTQVVEKAGAGVLIAAPFIAILTRAPVPSLILFAAGFLTLASTVLIHAVTLPTEFDASFNRALPILDKFGILKKVDRPHAHRLLTAAALTYVSASLMSLLNIARWFAILRR